MRCSLVASPPFSPGFGMLRFRPRWKSNRLGADIETLGVAYGTRTAVAGKLLSGLCEWYDLVLFRDSALTPELLLLDLYYGGNFASGIFYKCGIIKSCGPVRALR